MVYSFAMQQALSQFFNLPIRFIFVLIGMTVYSGYNQDFINGSFETNDGIETINMTIPDFNASVSNCVALEDFGAGGVPNIDLINVYGWGTYAPAQDGTWLLGLHKIDIVAIELTEPLVSGVTYTISFWNKYIFPGTTTNIELGASVGATDFGLPIGLVYVFTLGEWSYVELEFVAPNNATHITVSLDEVGPDDWVGIDNFAFVCDPLTLVDPVTAICVGEELTLDAVSPGGGTITWTGGALNGVPFIPGVGTHTYTATSSLDSECPISTTVLVRPLPAISAGVDKTVCIGESVTVTATGGGVGCTYLWDGGIVNGVPFIPLATTTYTVLGTNIYGCQNTDSMVVTVNLLPIIDAGIDDTICFGELVTLSGAGAGIAGTYLWDGGVVDGIAFAPDSTTTYTVIGTDENGCENTDEVTILLYELPLIDAGPDLSICIGEDVVLTGTGVGPGGFYTWDGGVFDGVAFYPDLTTTYTLSGTDANGCVNADDIIVTVHLLPLISAGLDQEICLGDAITLSGSGAGLGGSYVWDGGVVDGVVFTPGATQTFAVIGTDSFGCINTDEMVVTVNPIPEILFTGDHLADCPILDVNFSSVNPGDVFSWSFGDGSSGSGSTTNHTYSITGTYDVTLNVISVDGCVNEATYVNYIEVYPVPVAQFSYSPNEIQVSDPTVTFTNNSINSDSYLWTFGDGSGTSTESDPIHVYPSIGNVAYTVELIALNSFGCVDTTEKTVFINEEILYFVPNAFTPDGDQFNEEFKPIFVSGLDIYDYHLVIFNRWGEIVFESYNVANGWKGTYGTNGIIMDGTYVWTIDFGELKSDKTYRAEGQVTVLR
jgi:gliding motility-associated-like protein